MPIQLANNVYRVANVCGVEALYPVLIWEKFFGITRKKEIIIYNGKKKKDFRVSIGELDIGREVQEGRWHKKSKFLGSQLPTCQLRLLNFDFLFRRPSRSGYYLSRFNRDFND